MRLAGIAAQCITPLFATRTATVASNWVETPFTGQLCTFYKYQAVEVILWYLVHHSIHCIVLFGLPSAHIAPEAGLAHTHQRGYTNLVEIRLLLLLRVPVAAELARIQYQLQATKTRQ